MAQGQASRGSDKGVGGMGQETTLLGPHQQPILAASSVKPNHDARIRVPSTSSEKGTAAGLLGILSGVPLAHQGAFGSGDGVLIQGRPRARSAGHARKKDVATGKGKKGNEPSEAEDLIPPPPRKPSFPFQWAWESFSVDGRSLLLPSPDAPHQVLLPRRAHTSVLPPARPPRKSRWKAVPPAIQPANFPLYWRIEARCQDMKRQLKSLGPPEQNNQECQDGQEQEEQEDQDGREEEEGPEVRRALTLWPPCLPPEKRLGSKALGTKAGEEAEGEGQLQLGKSLQLARRVRFQEETGGETEAEEKVEQAQEQPVCLPTSIPWVTRSREEERDQLKEWKAFHLAGFTLLRGFRKKPGKLKEPEKLLDLEVLQKHLQEKVEESNLYSSQWSNQDSIHPRNEKLQAWEDDEPFPATTGTTRSFQKRREANRTLILDWERHQQEERSRAEQRHAREQRVQKQVARCLAAYGPPRPKGSGAFHRKLDELRLKLHSGDPSLFPQARRQEKQRLADYQAELQGIQQRVQSRPFLFQQAMQANARLSVTRRFSQVLSALGLDEEQLFTEALKDEAEEVPSKHRSSKTRKLARIRVEQPLWGRERTELEAIRNQRAEYKEGITRGLGLNEKEREREK